MPSFPDSAIIILLVLLLFGPKQLPVLARQFGKLMNDFRRASNEFRTQMEDELRISEQAERQKQLAASSAGKEPIEPAPASEAETAYSNSNLPPNDPALEPVSDYAVDTGDSPHEPAYGSMSESTPEPAPESASEDTPATLPIATSGDLSILPPSTGLPTPNSEPELLPEDPIPAHQATTETEALHP
jgi:sec-independent protein translocase protein TatB